jgi:MoxR-like ATPase
VFTNLLLADEINRAPAKVQSALLQAMQERCVTIGDATMPLPSPFMVLATQNPLEQEGTYPLPEAQVDRFLMKVVVGYPSFDEEIAIVNLTSQGTTDSKPLQKLASIEDILALRTAVNDTFVDPKIDRYVVSLVQGTRNGDLYGLKGIIEWGASPRASIALKVCARALAFLRGREFVTPDDVKEIAPDVLRHRILITFDGESRGITSDQVVATLLSTIAVP